MSGSRLRPYLGPLIALLVVLALGAGTVYAAIPNGNGKVYACYVKNTGAVRLINYPKVKTCAKGQRLITWNAKGPQGPVGPAGPQGVQGPKGDPGPADWNAIVNKPAGFADGVDNGDTTRSFIAATSGVTTPPNYVTLVLDYPVDLDVEVTVIPAVDGTLVSTHTNPSYGEEIFYRSNGRMYHYLYFYMYSGQASALKARVTVWNDDYIAPAAAKRMVDATFFEPLGTRLRHSRRSGRRRHAAHTLAAGTVPSHWRTRPA